MSLHFPTTAAYEAFLRKRQPPRVPAPRPKAPPPHIPLDPRTDLLEAVQGWADTHGWVGQHTFNASGPDAGLHLMLVRDVVLCAEVVERLDALTPSQHRWLDALQATGQVEVAVWTPADLPQIRARLSRPSSIAQRKETK